MRPAKEPAIGHDLTSEAAAWAVRLSREDAGEADWLAFAAWLDGAPADRPELHREAFDAAQRLWLQADALRGAKLTALPVRMPPRARSAMGWALAAAVCAMAVVLGLWLGAPPRPPTPTPPSSTYATAPGHPLNLVLPDGTHVALDGGTTLTVAAMRGQARAVTLVRGEAAFDVIHDPSRPFTVALGDARVRVLGTAFDVIRDPGVIEVSVARGRVALDAPSGSFGAAAGASATLVGGRVVIRSIDPTQVAAWRNGQRTYWNAPLGAVVADLNRTYASPIRLLGSGASSLRFTGVLAVGTRAQTVRRLTVLLPLQATTEPSGAILLALRRN